MVVRFLLMGALAAGLAMAQRGGKGGGSGGGDLAPRIEFGSRPDKLEQIAGVLKLNKDQKKAVKGVLDETQKEAAPLREELAKGRAQVAAAVEAKKSQDEINQVVGSYSELKAQMAGLEMKAFTKIFNGLEADQKANQSGIAAVFMMMNGMFQNKNWNAE